VKIEMGGCTDTGRLREHNEDNLLISAELGLAAVADGMGGHQAGEVASQIAVEVLSVSLVEDSQAATGEVGDQLAQVIYDANQRILEVAAERPECFGMGATIVAAQFHGDEFNVAHLGDSRLYRLREGCIEQLTEDHSLVQEFVRQGVLSEEEARASLNKNLITRALGISNHVQPDVSGGKMHAGDIYLLCSDGLTDVVTDARIAETLSLDESVDAIAARLVEMANAAGGPDNITVVVVRATEEAERGAED
jgi:protein phosphatase